MITFNLKSLNMYNGNYQISVISRSNRYQDSLPSTPLSYAVVSGIWVFNDNATLNGIAGDNYVLSFTSNGVYYSGLHVKQNPHSVPAMELYYYESNGTEVPVATQGPSVDDFVDWLNEAHRTIAFDGVQTVSKEFYEWLENNAVIQVETYKVSGTWKLNEVLQLPTDAISQSVNFKGYLKEYSISICDCTRMAVGVLTSNSQGTEFYRAVSFTGTHPSGTTSTQKVYTEKNGWNHQAYRTITFDGAQAVSKEFYDWLSKNAKIAIKGTWLFNQVIDSYKDYEQVSFVSGTTTYGGFDGARMNGYIYYDTTKVYDCSTDKWVNTIYRTITFDGTQYVSKQFYEYMKNNAVFAFTIDGITYYAKEGMTWGEWCESDYNTAGYYVKNGGAIHLDDYTYVAKTAYVSSTDRVEAGQVYHLEQLADGGGSYD